MWWNNIICSRENNWDARQLYLLFAYHCDMTSVISYRVCVISCVLSPSRKICNWIKHTVYCAFFSLLVSIIINIRFKIIDNEFDRRFQKSFVLLAESKDTIDKAILLTVYRLTETRGKPDLCKRKHKANVAVLTAYRSCFTRTSTIVYY